MNAIGSELPIDDCEVAIKTNAVLDTKKWRQFEKQLTSGLGRCLRQILGAGLGG